MDGEPAFDGRGREAEVCRVAQEGPSATLSDPICYRQAVDVSLFYQARP